MILLILILIALCIKVRKLSKYPKFDDFETSLIFRVIMRMLSSDIQFENIQLHLYKTFVSIIKN